MSADASSDNKRKIPDTIITRIRRPVKLGEYPGGIEFRPGGDRAALAMWEYARKGNMGGRVDWPCGSWRGTTPAISRALFPWAAWHGTPSAQPAATTSERTRTAEAGADFMRASPTLMCIAMAPSMSMAIPIAAGRMSSGTQKPTSKASAK